MSHPPEGAVWVSVGSHRARHAMFTRLGRQPESYGVWPLAKDGSVSGWPRGDYYALPETEAKSLGTIVGLKVLSRPPRGRIFRRV